MKTSAERRSHDVSLSLADTPRIKQLKDVRQKRLDYFNSLSYVLCFVVKYYMLSCIQLTDMSGFEQRLTGAGLEC